jgi:hypothetical protein
MALNLTTGTIKSTNFTSSPDTRIRFVDPRVFFAQAAIAPLMTFMEKFGNSKQATSTKVEWVEKNLGTPATTLGAAIANNTDTTITVVGYSMLTAGDVIWLPATDEQLLVGATPTSTSVTVVRGYGSTAAAAAADGAEVIKLSSSYAENAASGSGLYLNSSMPFNMTQIHRTPIDLSRTEMQMARYDRPGSALQDSRKYAMILHMEGVERAFVNGQLKDDTANARRTSAGLLRYIATNRENMSGAFTKAKFDSFLKDVMFNGGGEYVLFASGSMLEALNQEVLTNSNMNITPATKEWGLDIMNYLSPFGKCKIVYARVLSHILEGQYSGCGMLLDVSKTTKYFMQKMVLKENIQANDVDGRKDEYLEECAPALHNEANHGFIYGV